MCLINEDVVILFSSQSDLPVLYKRSGKNVLVIFHHPVIMSIHPSLLKSAISIDLSESISLYVSPLLNPLSMTFCVKMGKIHAVPVKEILCQSMQNFKPSG